MATARSKQSLWLLNAGVQQNAAVRTYPTLQSLTGAHYDAVVVGGGIFGCTTAYLLKESGKRVALIEARTVGSGVTGYSTAKLTAQQGIVYSKLVKKHNKKVARAYYDMNYNAVVAIEDLITRLNIDCEFSRRAHTTWTCVEESVKKVKDEYDTCMELGIECKLLKTDELVKELPASIRPLAGVRFENQAQFNPYKFCVELCKHINGGGSGVFEESRITSVSTTSPHKVQVGQDGSSITGDIVVLATHLPIMDRSMHFAILKPSRSLCIAIRVADPEAAIRMRNMSINAEKPTRYSLRVSGQEEDVIIICGEGFIQGEETETDQLYAKIEDWAREHFPVKEVITRWSSMDYKTDDHIPYIGYLHRGTNTLFTATGFSKWGLAAGFAGANVVNDLIRGIANPYHEMVDARRWDLLAQWKGLVYEQWHTTKHLLGDKIKHMISRDNIDSLKAGQGGIVRVKGEKVGAYLDENGQYHFVKPVCTHLGCDLLFNQGDKVWDCPCHGSQFAVDGSVIHGPACKPLTQLKDLEW